MIQADSRTPHTHLVHGEHGLFADCPDCNGRDFLVEETGVVLFACLSCGSHWHYHLGYVWRINTEQHESDIHS